MMEAPSTELTVHTNSPHETMALGEQIGRAAQAGDCIALIGELGAGKTVMAKGIAQGLGIEPDAVTSPTFVLIARHQGELPLYHFDAYRLSAASEMSAIGAEEMLYGKGVCVIEWADRMAEILPEDRLEIRMIVTAETGRNIRVRSTGRQSLWLARALG